MRVTIYFLVRLITLYGLSAATVQGRHYSDVLELNQVYDRFDPEELEAAYGITPIEHPLTEPSFVTHLAGFNVHGTDKSQEAPEIKSTSSSEEKKSQLTWPTSGKASTAKSVKDSQEHLSLINKSVQTKNSNEDLSIATQRSSTENVSKSRKFRENRSQENADSKLIRDSTEQQHKSSEELNLLQNRGSASLKKVKNQSRLSEKKMKKLPVDSKELVNDQTKSSYTTIKRKISLPNVNSQEYTNVENQMQNDDKKKQGRAIVIKPADTAVQNEKRDYKNAASSNEQKSISHGDSPAAVNDRIKLVGSQEFSNETPAKLKKNHFEYLASSEKSFQGTWNQRESQENEKSNLNKDQRKRKPSNQSGQSSTNSREKLNSNQYYSNEQEDQSYENRRGLQNKNQEKSNEYRVWSSYNQRDHRNKHQDHRHVKRSQSLLNSQEEQLLNSQLENQKQTNNQYSTNSQKQENKAKVNLRVQPNVIGQKQRQQNYDSHEEIQNQVSNMNSLQYRQYIANLRYQRENNLQSQENASFNREQRMQAGYRSHEEKSQESGSSEEQREQSTEYKRKESYQPSSVEVFRKLNQFLVNSNEDRPSQINSKTVNQQKRSPKSEENNKTGFRKTKNTKQYQKNKKDDISVESSEEMTDAITRKSFDNYYSKENVMVPFVYSMHSPMPMNVRKIFMMSKSYMNNPLDYQTAKSDYIHGFHNSEDMVRFHETLEESMKQNKNTKMNSTELITLNRYAVEEHNVTTEDGYILQMIRMTGPQDSLNARKKPVVFLMHGFLGSSDDWLLMGPKKAFAYLLVDAGYDVWLGNARGNKYSRKHITKNPDQPEFWKFSNDEIALADLPAMIDYALNTTQQKQMFYVGFSQGNAQFFALASSRPEYNAKIKIMYALSPMSFMKNSHSMLVKMFAPENPLSELIEKYMETYSKTGEFKFQDKFLSLAGKDICMATIGCNTVCSNINFIMSGVNVEQLEPEMAAMILGHAPAGGSVRQMIQLGQATEDFRMFDYGIMMNKEVYGTSEPPSYNVKLVTAPVAMYSSKDDWLAATEDVEKLEAELPNVIKNYKIKNNYFTNLDFIFGKMATEMYKNIISSMSGFDKIKRN